MITNEMDPILDEYDLEILAECENDGEKTCVLDAIANDEDAEDALEEYRHWRSPRGRLEEGAQ